jgi:Hemerythrin HHE cation binding domain
MTSDFELDMTMMYAVHDAFRRELEPVAQMTARSEGWDFFERFLQAHHVAEDDALWPVLRERVAGRAEDLALLDDMEAEHAALGPLLDAIDDGLDRGESAPGARADLAARLQEHLAHEEEAGLPLIDRTLGTEQWIEFGDAAAARIGPDMPHFLRGCSMVQTPSGRRRSSPACPSPPSRHIETNGSPPTQRRTGG